MLRQWTKAIVVSKVLLNVSLWNDSFRSNRQVNAYDHFSLPRHITDRLPTGHRLSANTLASNITQTVGWRLANSWSGDRWPTVSWLSPNSRPTVKFGNYSSLLPKLELITIKILHLDLLWKRDWRELGNNLLLKVQQHRWQMIEIGNL